MNEYQTKLYTDLMGLVQESEAFFFSDQEICGQSFRIFNYRLSSYSEFLKPSAMECRGVMFEITGEGYEAKPIRLASFPMQKFFNLYEVSSDINTLAECLIKQGRLSEDVYRRAKNQNTK